MEPTTNVATLKEETLEALMSDVNQVEDVPQIGSVEDFDLCRVGKEKGKPAGGYVALDETKELKDLSFGTWEVLFIRFKEPSAGNEPITFTAPSIDDEDTYPAAHVPEESVHVTTKNKGKRKERDEDPYADDE